MESWRNVWQRGLAPLLTIEALEFLREGLVTDDPRLLQGATTCPPPLQCVQEWPVEAACVIGYCGAKQCGGFVKNTDGTENPNATTVAQCEEFFARTCADIDIALGEPAACRWFLNYFDNTPRSKVFQELLEEVNLTLEQRRSQQNGPPSEAA